MNPDTTYMRKFSILSRYALNHKVITGELPSVAEFERIFEVDHVLAVDVIDFMTTPDGDDTQPITPLFDESEG